MAKIICTKDEYDKLSIVLTDNPEFLANISILYDIVEESPTIPKDYLYDTETNEFYVYRHKYTGDEIHIVKEPSIYLIMDERLKAILGQSNENYTNAAEGASKII